MDNFPHPKNDDESLYRLSGRSYKETDFWAKKLLNYLKYNRRVIDWIKIIPTILQPTFFTDKVDEVSSWAQPATTKG